MITIIGFALGLCSLAFAVLLGLAIGVWEQADTAAKRREVDRWALFFLFACLFCFVCSFILAGA